MFLFCNEDKKKKERLNSVLKTTHNLIKKNDIKDVRKNPVYSLIRAMSNYHLYDIVRELYEDEEVTDVQSIYKDIGEYLINSEKLNNSKSFELGESNINIDLSKDAILVCAWNKQRFVDALLNIGQNVGNSFEYDKTNHMATYIFPIGLTIVYNGNHSSLSGILKGEGTIQANQTYGIRAEKALASRIKGNPVTSIRNSELNQNIINNYTYNELNFYTGNFKAVKAVSKNPSGSLGWSNCFVGEGICLFLLYLFEDAVPSKAAKAVANSIGFSGLQ